MTLGEIIKAYRTSHGMSQDAIAERSGLSKAYISILERNRNPKTGRPPVVSLKAIGALAAAVNSSFDEVFNQLNADVQVSVADQLPAKTGTVSTPTLSKSARSLAQQYDGLDEHGREVIDAVMEKEVKRMHPAPVVKPATRSIPLFGNSFAAGVPEPDFGNQWEDYEVPYDTKADFAIRINGDSMEPYLPDGSIALGKRGQPGDGDVGAFLLDGEFLCKQFCQDHLGNIYLFSLNRARRDADVTLWHNAEHSLFCFGKILMKKSVPLPSPRG